MLRSVARDICDDIVFVDFSSIGEEVEVVSLCDPFFESWMPCFCCCFEACFDGASSLTSRRRMVGSLWWSSVTTEATAICLTSFLS